VNAKRLILIAVSAAFAVAAFFAFSSADRSPSQTADSGAKEVVRRFVSGPGLDDKVALQEGDMPYRPGEYTRVRIYDEVTGRLKSQFEAKTWEPTSENTFHLTELAIQLYTPRGQICYIEADQADVTLARKSGNNIEPRSGTVRGNVKVTIDRTTTEWREHHPDRADRFAHAEELINIFLDEARFDMDRAEVKSGGEVVVDSTEARIEKVRGLTLQWNQLDNRIDVLRFGHGGRMVLRRGGEKVMHFALPGTPTHVDADEQDDAPTPTDGDVPRARAMKPMSIAAITADQAAAEIRLEGASVAANQPVALPTKARPPGPANEQPLRSSEDLATAVDLLRRETRAATEARPIEPADVIVLTDLPDNAKRKKIHSYNAVFENDVVVEQVEGLVVRGRLEADKLELNFDFGEQQRNWVRPGQAQPRPNQATDPTPPDESPDTDPPEQAERAPVRVVLTWDGPLEMRPLQADAETQTGERFDAIATGTPVRVESDQGTATCRQLVYRNEKRQVWLSALNEGTVELSVSPTQRVIGREVFFDQSRGLARIDGAGRMIHMPDETNAPQRKPGARLTAASDTPPPESVTKARNRLPDDPIEITWSRGVELELGRRIVHKTDPQTGMKVPRKRDYLRRAWFHGGVMLDRGDERLSADEVAATFAVPLDESEVADRIAFLNMAGDVSMQRDDESITAQRLDIEMLPDGRNPRYVDGQGTVRTRQGDRIFRADEMHVEMDILPGQRRMLPDGKVVQLEKDQPVIRTLSARRNIFARDPEANLRVSRAKQLDCKFRNRQELIHTTIVSRSPEVFARARVGDVAVHGHRIAINLDDETADVPGPGRAYMPTQFAFGGRQSDGPQVVRITWTDWMKFRLARNHGEFVGQVHSTSDTFSLDADKLVLRFDEAPPLPSRQPRKRRLDRLFARADDVARWTALSIGPLNQPWMVFALPVAEGIDQVGRFRAATQMITRATRRNVEEPSYLASRKRKEPVYVVADGNAVAVASNHAPTAGGAQRLSSRMLIKGERIISDLRREQMKVPGPGVLLIEDYQFDPRPAQRMAARSASGSAAFMSSMRDEGPSQTLVQWKNGMDFFSDRQLVVFDEDVRMHHASGRHLVLRDELASAMGIDRQQIRRLTDGRKAELTCGNLIVEFARSGSPDEGGLDAQRRATDLKRLIATHEVHLEEDTKSLMAEHLQYLLDTGEVRLEGAPGIDARIFDQSEQSQTFNMWRGPLLIWNRNTNRIIAPQATIRSSRR